jgi:WD40 repeat protein
LVAANGQLLLTSNDDERSIRNVRTGRLVWDLTQPYSAGGPWSAAAAAFSSDGKVVAYAQGGRLLLFDLTKGKELPRLRGHRDQVWSLWFSDDGKQLTTSCGAVRCVWDVTTGRPISRDERYAGRLPAGHRAVGVWALSHPVFLSLPRGGPLQLRDFATARVLRNLDVRPSDISRALVTADGQRFMVPDGGSEKVARYAVVHGGTGERLGRFTSSHDDAQLHWSPRGRYCLRTNWRGLAQVLDGTSGRHFRTLRNEGNKGEDDWQLTLPWHAFCREETVVCLHRGLADHMQRWVCDSFQAWHVPTGKVLFRWDAESVKDGSLRLGYALSGDARTVATMQRGEPTVTLWDTLTGRRCGSFVGHVGERPIMAFSPDNQTLATGGLDGTVLLWDMAAASSPAHPRRAQLTPRQWADLWHDLADADPRVARSAVAAMAAAPADTVLQLRKRLRPVPPASPKRVAALMEALKDDSFTVRQKAERELAWLGTAAEAALRRALRGPLDLEQRSRIERLLVPLAWYPLAGDRVREVRAVEALERIASPDGLKLLRALAGGVREARLTEEAKMALARLQRSVKK